MFRRDDHDLDVEDEVSQFRRQADVVDDEDRAWDRESTPPWESRPDDSPLAAEDLPPAPTSSTDEARASVVSAESTWTGTLASDGPIEIYGAVNGELVAAGNVYIAPGANVDARIQAVNLTVAGSLQGSVACTNRFEALETGSVNGDVLAPTIVIHDGARIIGEFRMRDDEPVDANGDEDLSES